MELDPVSADESLGDVCARDMFDGLKGRARGISSNLSSSPKLSLSVSARLSSPSRLFPGPRLRLWLRALALALAPASASSPSSIRSD